MQILDKNSCTINLRISFNELWEIVAHSNNYTLFSLFARGVIVIYEATRIKNNLIQWNNAASVPEQ